ncbi:MAG: Hsp70 family protein [Planctomycetes bacterium]|nr:Hsp70 family protein [Planctomycetota bacterium]
MTGGQFYLGIDLGTTTSVAAYADSAGHPSSLTNFEGDVLTPSAVFFDQQRLMVGREAIKAATSDPERFVECFKRHMGEPAYQKPIDGRTYRPEFLSAVVLRRLKRDIHSQLGDVSRAVVTVPAYFDASRRRATQNAARIAGWEVADIINEPTAAALAYAHRTEQLQHRTGERQRILVYDLGGGTFDTTILSVCSGREYRTLATEGEVRLGGCDWDQRLCEHLAEEFRKKTGGDPLTTARGRATFLRTARQVKHTLSSRKLAAVPCSWQGRRALLSVTRDTFESLTRNLLERTRDTTQIVLEEAGLGWNQLDRILLVGGASRMPMVARMLHSLTGKKPDQSVSADEAVAHGAAIYCWLQAMDSSVRVVNVASHTLRIVVRKHDVERLAIRMIDKNSELPSRRTVMIPVSRPGQRSIRVEVCEGENRDPNLCERLGVVRINGLPADGTKRWKVALDIQCQKDGLVGVTASVRDPDQLSHVVKEVSAVLEPSRSLNQRQLQQARRLLDSFEIA